MEQPPTIQGTGAGPVPPHETTALGGAVPFTSSSPDWVGRYRALGRVGSGGMGEVFLCEDPDLQRRLAVKVLQARHGENAGLVRRFVAEARLTGQLQHPGIPPIHEVGWLPDGRPFFSMKLVGGDTLAALLARRGSPADDLPRFLNYFEQVCQAVAYAHSRGVIHRDLKPGNIMVGAFGEVQVMDWGLAKRLGAPPAPPEEDAAPARRADQTLAGSIMGTPGFMPPEQARGDIEQIDERADVYGLGAILCVILTGKPPSPESITLGLEPEEALPEAEGRLRDCGAARELIELAGRCLAPVRERRPRHAGEVADAVARYQAAAQEKTRRAEQERAAAEARALEERKRNRLRLVLGLVALVALAVMGAGAWLFERWRADVELSRLEESARQERLRAEAAAVRAEALGRGRELLRAGRWNEAQTVLGQARPLGELGDGTDDEERLHLQRLARLGDDLDQAAAAVLFERREGGRRAERRMGRLLADAGMVRPGEPDSAAVARMRALPIRAHLVSALDRWADQDEAGRERAIRLALLLDDDSWRNQVRRHLREKNHKALEKLAKEAATPDRPAASLRLLVEALGVVGLHAEALALLQDVQPRHPSDLWLALHHVTFLSKAGREAEAVERNRAALALRPDVPSLWSNQGLLLRAVGRHDEALMHHRRAVALAPHLNVYWDNYGLSLVDAGRPREAIRMHQKATALAPEDAVAWSHLGSALSKAGRGREALEAAKYALSLDEELVTARVNLAQYLRLAGRNEQSLRHLDRALKLAPELPEALAARGATLLALGRAKEAGESYEAAVRLKPDFGRAHYDLAQVLEEQGRFAEAIEHARAADTGVAPAKRAAFLGRLFVRDRKPHVAVLFLREAVERGARDGETYALLAASLRRSGRSQEAVEAAKKALAVEPNNAMANYEMGYALMESEPRAAIRHFLLVVPTNPAYEHSAYKLAYTYQESGDLVRAEKYYRVAIKADANHAEAHCNLGHVLRRRGRFVEAAAPMRRGHELGSRLRGWNYPSARWVAELDRLAALERRLPGLLDGTFKPEGAADALAVARFCVRLGKNADAVRFYEAAFKMNATAEADLNDGARVEAAAAAVRAGDRKKALAWLRAELAGWKKLVEAAPATARPQLKQALARWEKEPGFAPRGAPAGERTQWEEFFREARALLARGK